MSHLLLRHAKLFHSHPSTASFLLFSAVVAPAVCCRPLLPPARCVQAKGNMRPAARTTTVHAPQLGVERTKTPADGSNGRVPAVATTSS